MQPKKTVAFGFGHGVHGRTTGLDSKACFHDAPSADAGCQHLAAGAQLLNQRLREDDDHPDRRCFYHASLACLIQNKSFQWFAARNSVRNAPFFVADIFSQYFQLKSRIFTQGKLVNKSSLCSVLLSAALLAGCSSVGVGFGIPIGPFSIGVGAGSGGVSLGVGTGVGPFGVGVGVNQSGQVTGGAGVGVSTTLGNSKARVGAGVGAGTVLYDPKSQAVQPAAPKKGVEMPESPRSPTLLN